MTTKKTAESTCLSEPTMQNEEIKIRCPGEGCTVKFILNVPVFDAGNPMTKTLRRIAQELTYCDACSDRLIYEQEAQDNSDTFKHRHSGAVARGDLTRLFLECNFEKSDPHIEGQNPGAWDDLRQWNGATNLYLSGHTGTGKTFAGRCLLHRYFTTGKTIAEISARRLFKVSDAFDEGRGDFDRWKKVYLLLLDDIDKCRITESRLDALW